MIYTADDRLHENRLGFRWNQKGAVISLACAFVISACGDNSGNGSSTAITIPTPTPNVSLLYPKPDSSTLVAGYMLDTNGCVVSTAHLPPSTPRPVDENELVRLYGNKTSSFYMERGTINFANNEYSNAIADLRRALSAQADPLKQDYNVRLRLSIALFRIGEIDEAKEQWRTMLSHEDPARANDPSAHGISLLRVGQYQAGFRDLYVTPPNFNTISFGDSGAAAHLGNGLQAASEGHYDTAMREWRLAETCSDYFQVPHLMRGFVYQMRGQRARAAEEWIKTLQGWDPAPPDTAGITGAQYDAMRELL